MERSKKFPKQKKHHFIRDHLMGWQNYIPIGSLKIIEKPIICLLVMVFYLIMVLNEEDITLLKEKLL